MSERISITRNDDKSFSLNYSDYCCGDSTDIALTAASIKELPAKIEEIFKKIDDEEAADTETSDDSEGDNMMNKMGGKKKPSVVVKVGEYMGND